MFIEASNPRKLNDTAVLQSKIFLPSGERCLQFYYHMYGEDMGAMHVLYSSDAGDKKIWEKQQDQEISGIWLMSSFLPRNPLTG